jgi:predicted porin
MSAINCQWVRGLASAGAGLALVIAALAPANAANLGGSCCADLEERVAELEATVARKGQREKVELKISGAVSRALLFWDDGTEQNVYSVDNAKSASTFAFDGEVEFAKGWRAGFTLGVDAIAAGSDQVSQLSDTGPGGFFFDLADSFFFIANDRLGTVRVGQTDSASDKIDNFLLTGADVVADNAVQDFVGSFLLRAENGALLDIVWADFIPPVAGTNANLVTYVSPEWMGFTTSSSWGMDDWRDVALRYRGEWVQAFEVQAGIGYYRDTTRQGAIVPGLPVVDTREPVEDEGWGGGIALNHKPTGLNIAFNYSTVSHTDRCAERGAVSGKCRGDDEFIYVTGGLIRDLVSFGPTSFYGEYYTGTREWNDSDLGKLAALELNLGQAGELEESDVTVWGFGVVQKFNDATKPAGKKDAGAAKDAAPAEPIMEIFLGYKHYELDVELIGTNLAAPASAPIDVPSKKLNDFDVVVTGAIIRF